MCRDTAHRRVSGRRHGHHLNVKKKSTGTSIPHGIAHSRTDDGGVSLYRLYIGAMAALCQRDGWLYIGIISLHRRPAAMTFSVSFLFLRRCVRGMSLPQWHCFGFCVGVGVWFMVLCMSWHGITHGIIHGIIHGMTHGITHGMTHGIMHGIRHVAVQCHRECHYAM